MSDIVYSPLISIFDTSPDGFFIVQDCVIEYANQVMCNMAGENLVGKAVIDVFDKNIIKDVTKTLDETNTFFINEIELFNKQCSVRIAGTATGFLVTVSELKAVDDKEFNTPWSQADILEACEEMRSPLTTIFGALTLISKKLPEDVPEKVLDYLAIINQNCYKLLKRTDCMVDFIRYLDDSKSHYRNYNIAVILREFTEEIRARISDIEIDLLFECKEDCLVVNCDMTKIKRAVLNVLTSIIKYMKTKNNIKIKLSESGRSVILRFCPGDKNLTQEEITEIFRKQVNKNTVANQCGSSLLLIKTIIEAHGGNVFMENDQQEGSIITVMLPKSDKPYYISSDPAPYISDFMLGMSELSEVLPFEAYSFKPRNTNEKS